MFKLEGGKCVDAGHIVVLPWLFLIDHSHEYKAMLRQSLTVVQLSCFTALVVII